MENFNGNESSVLEKLSCIMSEVAKISGVIAEMAAIKEQLFSLTEKVDHIGTCCNCSKENRLKLKDSSNKDNREEIAMANLKQHGIENSQCDTMADRTLAENSKAEDKVTDSELLGEKNQPSHIDKVRKRRQTKDIEADCLGKALQENIVTLVEDIQFSSSGLGDLLIGNDCLTGDECAALCSLSHKDQIRNAVRLIKGRSYEVIRKFLKCVQRFHPEASDKIWKTFEDKRKNFVCDRLCAYCKLKRSIDIRYVADNVWSIDGISDSVYADVVSHTSYNITDDSKWERFAEACNKSENKKILKTIINALERKGYYSHIIPSLKRETKLACRCSDVIEMKVGFKTPLEITDDDRSTLSPISSPDDMEYPSLSDAQDLYSSENSMEMDEETRFNVIRLHVSNIVSDAQNCLALTGKASDDDLCGRQRSSSFVKNKRLPVPLQRRASCFNF